MVHPANLPYYFLLTTYIADVPGQILAADSGGADRIDKSGNAVWLEHRWLQDGVPDEEIVALSGRLRANGIRYVYPHLTPSDADGHLPSYSRDAARRFCRLLRKQAPGIRILPWVGGVQVGFHQMRPGTIRLDSEVYRQAFAKDCIAMIRELGLDGIHLNVEPVESGDRRLLEWLDYLKTRLGERKILSVAGSKPSFFEGFNVSPLRSWDLDYYTQVASRCNQLVIMSYDTGISHSLLYSLFVMEKTGTYLQRLKSEGISCRLMVGVPTYDDAPRHRQDVENIASAVRGLSAAFNRSEIGIENFEGIAIYAYWTTDPNEWKDFQSLWLHRREAKKFTTKTQSAQRDEN